MECLHNTQCFVNFVNTLQSIYVQFYTAAGLMKFCKFSDCAIYVLSIIRDYHRDECKG